MLGWLQRTIACAVCFGPTDAPMAQGLEFSILFLIVLTYGLIGTGAGFVAWRWRRRTREDGRLAEKS